MMLPSMKPINYIAKGRGQRAEGRRQRLKGGLFAFFLVFPEY